MHGRVGQWQDHANFLWSMVALTAAERRVAGCFKQSHLMMDVLHLICICHHNISKRNSNVRLEIVAWKFCLLNMCQPGSDVFFWLSSRQIITHWRNDNYMQNPFQSDLPRLQLSCASLDIGGAKCASHAKTIKNQVCMISLWTSLRMDALARFTLPQLLRYIGPCSRIVLDISNWWSESLSREGAHQLLATFLLECILSKVLPLSSDIATSIEQLFTGEYPVLSRSRWDHAMLGFWNGPVASNMPKWVWI